jgi:hypothetical protein
MVFLLAVYNPSANDPIKCFFESKLCYPAVTRRNFAAIWNPFAGEVHSRTPTVHANPIQNDDSCT